MELGPLVESRRAQMDFDYYPYPGMSCNRPMSLPAFVLLVMGDDTKVWLERRGTHNDKDHEESTTRLVDIESTKKDTPPSLLHPLPQTTGTK